MSLSHTDLSEPTLALADLGKRGQSLYIKTGVLVFTFGGVQGQDWQRDFLERDVIDLPAGRFFVQATATAAPASLYYAPPAIGSMVASGGFSGGGWGDGETLGPISVSGTATLPVSGAPGDISAGWAVDQARAERQGNKVRLRIDVAARGPSAVLRVAYSVFAVLTPARIVRER